MSEVVNTNVFSEDKKFVDIAGLRYFLEKTKGYVDGADSVLSGKISENTLAIESINEELATLDGGLGSVGTQIDNKIAELKLSETYEAKGDAAKAQAAAEAYTDSKVDGKFDAVGSASQALVDAKKYTDDEIAKLSFDEAGTAESLVNAHAADEVKHITNDERTAWNEAKAAITAFLKDADMTEKAVDTLAELQTYMTNDGAAATALIGRVAALEAINHEAYVAADEVVLETAKKYADDEIAKLSFDAAGSAATAEQNAKDYADGKFQEKGNYEEAGAAAQALADAKSYVDGKDSAMNTRVEALEGFDHSVYAKAADVYVKSEVDSAVAAAEAAAKADAATKLAGYYSKTEVDNLLSTNSTGDRAYAKSYTDQLFDSIKFVENSEIDALFA